MRARIIAAAVLVAVLVAGYVGVGSAQTGEPTDVRINASDSVVWNDDLTIRVEYPNGSGVRNASVVFNGMEHHTDDEGEVVVTPESVGRFEVVATKNDVDARRGVRVLPRLRLELSRDVVPLGVETSVRATVKYAHNGSPAEGVTVNASGGRAVTGEGGSGVVLVTSNREFGAVTVNASRRGAGGARALMNTSGAYVFGISTKSKPYWTLVFLFAFVVVGAVVVNQLVSDTLVLKE